MPRKRYKPEEIVAKLRQVDVLTSQGQNIADAIRQIGVSEVTYYRWRQEYGRGGRDRVGSASQRKRSDKANCHGVRGDQHLPLFAVQSNGFFAKRGLEIELNLR